MTLPGDYIGKVTPVPIPNTVVKLSEPMIVRDRAKVGIAGIFKQRKRPREIWGVFFCARTLSDTPAGEQVFSELPAKWLLDRLDLSTSKYHQWKDRYGKTNEHNGQVPRDGWLEDWEKQAMLDDHERYPLKGYPQSNGKLERWHASLKQECIRPKCPGSLGEARARRQQNRAAAKAVA